MKIKLTHIVSILVVFLTGLAGSGLFYWYELRPASFRRECSWVKMINKAEPSIPAITKEEAQRSKVEYNECLVKNNLTSYKKNESMLGDIFNENLTWDQVNRQAALDKLFNSCKSLSKEERQAVPAKPEGHWYRQADEKEYKLCLHQKGLQ